MITLNFDAATEQALNALAQTEERSIEQVLIEALLVMQKNWRTRSLMKLLISV